MNAWNKTLIGIVAGAVLGASGVWFLSGGGPAGDNADAGERTPLYWVAPMDPNYKRDKPGKSPMGMDLIPVYEEEGAGQSSGTVTINPDVVNNLGVRTAKVVRGVMPSTVKTVGYVQYDEDHLTHINPRVEGWLEKLYIKAAGDPVKKGEPIYAIYSPTLVNAQEELLLALKRDNPPLIKAAIERLLALEVPQSAIDKLKETRRVSQTITVRAPQSGVADQLQVREGMFVQPGMSLMTIAQLEHIWVIGEVFERQASLVQKGNSVQMRLDYVPGREWQGQADYIYPSLDPTTRTARVRVHINNPDGYLRPGMFAQMRIQGDSMENALLIPREALIRTGNQSRVVLALGAGRFKSITVEVGHITAEQVQITSGLTEGDRVVTSAQFLIDSESSKTSDFRRMSHGSDDNEESALPTAVWVTARIESLMPEHRMLTLAHDPIDAWQWSAMTMDFTVVKDVDLTGLVSGMTLHVEVTRKGDNEYVISGIHRPDGNDDASDTGNKPEAMNHDGMQMDHSQHSMEDKQ